MKPYVAPELPAGQINVSDPDSRVMRTQGTPPRQAYNAQAAVNDRQIILAAEVTVDAAAQPAAAFVLSPWTDLTLSGETMTSMVGIDPVFTREKVSVRAADYVASSDPADPSISPIFADLHGLPPILIQAGSHEILLDDSIRLARRAAVNDVNMTLDVTSGVPHGFQAFAAILDEGDAALTRAAAFLDHHLRWAEATT